MKLLIVVHHRFELWNVPVWFVERLRKEFPQLQIVHRNRYDGIEDDLREAEIIFTISLRPEQLAIATNVRWIHTATAAVHQFLFPQLVESDVLLTNSSEVHGPVVAEHAIALICALAKKIPQAVRYQQKRLWGKAAMWDQGPHPRELEGATLGLVGLGSIGKVVAKKAAALGMRIIAVREHPEKGRSEGVSMVLGSAQLDQLLTEADFVVLAAPLTPATEKLMNAARFDKMKPSAYLINVGRGPQVDEASLLEALRSRRIAGAALDVFEQEPLSSDSPLWGLENLLITPHSAGITEKLWQRHYDLFCENLRRYLAHQTLAHVVDKHRGY